MMKRLTSINYSNNAFNIGMLVLRAACGVLIIPHGFNKLVHFSSLQSNFINLFGIGNTTSLALVIFAEFICGMLLVVGLFTRFAVIPLIITMAVALYKAHHLDFFGDGEKAALYLAAFFTLLLCGPGRASIDGMIK